MTGRFSKLAATLILVAAPGAASTADLVAVVQSVEAADTPVGAMQLVEPGRVFDLGDRGRLVLGYMRSCLHEEITGGRVTVGARRSTVDGGRVSRRRVECDGGALTLTPRQSTESSTLIFRAPPGGLRPVVIRRSSPVIGVPGEAGLLRIVRLDGTDAALTVRLDHGFVDLAARAIRLAPGGLYELNSGARSLVVRVDVAARGGGGPVVGRLIAF